MKGIKEKHGHNHPEKDRGDPTQHPDWDKWQEHEYYCKLDGHGYKCPDCKFWWTCIMQLYSWSYISDYRSGRIDPPEPRTIQTTLGDSRY